MRGWTTDDAAQTFGEAVDDLQRRIHRLEANVGRIHCEGWDWSPGEGRWVQRVERVVPVTDDLNDFGNPWTERDIELWAEAAKHDGSDVGDC